MLLRIPTLPLALLLFFGLPQAGTGAETGVETDPEQTTSSALTLEQITSEHTDQRISVEGDVISVLPPLTASSRYVVLLRDRTSETLRLTVPAEVWDRIPFQKQIETEAHVQATAMVTGLIRSAEDGVVVWATLSAPEDLKLGFSRTPSVPEMKAEKKAEEAEAKAKATAAKWHWGWVAAAGLTLLFGAGVQLYLRHRKADSGLSEEELAEQERARKALQQGMARVEHLLHAGPSVIYSLPPPADSDQTGSYQLTWISDSVERILGYSPRECLENPVWWIEHVHPEDRAAVEQGAREAMRRNGVFDREYRIRHRDGTWRWVLDHQRLLRNAQGTAYEILGTWSDVTERARNDRMKMIFASLGQRLSAITTKEEAARVALRVADELFGWDACYVSLYSAAGDHLKIVVGYDVVKGRRKELVRASDGIPVAPLIREVLNGNARLLLREGTEPSPLDNLRLIGEQRRSASLLFAPIRKAGTGIGLFSIQSYSPQTYRHEDVMLLQLLADYCGAALERTMAEEQRKEAEERYALALRGANDGLWDWDLRAGRIYYSPRWKAMLGHEDSEIGSSPEDWTGRIHKDDLERVNAEVASHVQGRTDQLELQFRMLHKDGEYRWMLMRGVAVRDAKGEAYRMAGSLTDVTLRKRAEEQLMHGAYYDALTGLPNRLLFTEQLRRAVSRCRRHPENLFAVLFIDLDRFKIINDSLGHLVGDQLLVNVAERLKNCVRPEDTVARLGGDEFTILLEDIQEPSDATRIAERIQEELVKPVNLGGHDVYSTASIGIALSSTGYDKAEDILRDADAAMYRAKQKGKARHELFDSAMHQRALEVLRLEAELRRALERDEFRVVYQPFISLRTGQISGFEALARWQHPQRGLVTPSEFIPLAEENGLILPIGWNVLREACHQVREWQTLRPADQPLTVSVNFSRKQFAQPDLVKGIAGILEETGLDPACLALEITESVLMENAESLERLLMNLKALGLQLHIDDFGTGYSSLSYLHRFPIDSLKIDRSFVSRITPDGQNAEIVKAIVNLATSLGISVVAEGVETHTQMSLLRSLSCDLVQGYLLNRPLMPEDVPSLLGYTPVPAH